MPALDRRVVVGGLLVEHVRHLAEHAEAVGEADRHVELAHVSSSSSTPSHSPYVGEPRRRSTATSRIRPRAQRTSLATPAPIWKCMPRTHPARRARVVVLDELLLRGDPRLGVPLVAVGLAEEAPLVAVRDGSMTTRPARGVGTTRIRRQRVAVGGQGGDLH